MVYIITCTWTTCMWTILVALILRLQRNNEMKIKGCQFVVVSKIEISNSEFNPVTDCGEIEFNNLIDSQQHNTQ